MIRLSICIPTYNRAETLKMIVKRFLCEIEGKNNVELIISDNGSTDDTNDYLAKIENEKSDICNINIIRHRRNLGFDVNICSLLERADGDYIWFVSDDDYVQAGVVSDVLKMLSINPSLLYLRITPLHENQIYIDSEAKKNIIDDNFMKISDKSEALLKIHWLVTFLSSHILKKEFISDNFKLFVGSGFVHTPMIMDCISHGNVIISNTQTLLMRLDNGGGYARYRYFGRNIHEIFDFYIDYFTKSDIRLLTKKWIKGCLRNNVIKNEININKPRIRSLRNKKTDLLFSYYSYMDFWIWIAPFLFIPSAILRLFARVVLKFSNNDRINYVIHELITPKKLEEVTR